MRQAACALWAAAVLAASAASAQSDDPSVAPGGVIDPVGVSGSYRCTAGPAKRIDFRFVAFEGGLHKIEEKPDVGPAFGTEKYSWQLATATLHRQRVTAKGAEKFRRVNGSLRTVQELTPNTLIKADYIEVPLDASALPIEWRYEIAIGVRAVSFGPSGVGEVAVIPITERRSRYVDGDGKPLALTAASSGFNRIETARIAYAPELGLPLRIERQGPDGLIEACSLSAYKKP